MASSVPEITALSKPSRNPPIATVKATNAAGSSLASGSSASVTPATVPSAPTIGSASYGTGIAYGSNPQVTVSWTAGNAGGSAITGYTVSSSPAGGTRGRSASSIRSGDGPSSTSTISTRGR